MSITTQDAPLVAGGASAGAQALVAVRVLNAFLLPGQDDPQPGDELQLPKALALELAMYRKVEILPDAVPFTAAPAATKAGRGKPAQGAPAP